MTFCLNLIHFLNKIIRTNRGASATENFILMPILKDAVAFLMV